jgi:hypothetical protein
MRFKAEGTATTSDGTFTLCMDFGAMVVLEDILEEIRREGEPRLTALEFFQILEEDKASMKQIRALAESMLAKHHGNLDASERARIAAGILSEGMADVLAIVRKAMPSEAEIANAGMAPGKGKAKAGARP